ncbi:DNA-processing protein DprA [Methylotenera sp. 1P/1]|uniref:DNA-processing protein DprA n=1 Tax=Methylotenera sp. 1P/1 TaxID=1131551 RepID=UPI000372FE0E|nr:DNA-processing protein DprA [Methylotenera sp. 1P/1]
MPEASVHIEPDVAQWVALSLIDGVGSATLCQLLSQFGTPANVFAASRSQLRHIVSDNITAAICAGVDEATIAPTLEWLSQPGNHLITLADSIYPKALLEIANPPALLYAKGQPDCLSLPCLAVVGSRNATPQGEKNAEDFAENLSRHGLCIVSGMALGIDGAAHRGALKANAPTIAVVGTGLDIVYPAKHRDLAHRIVNRGLIISEFPLGTPSKAQNFPRRNRIISGLSIGCLVIEANLDSGSLITARQAAEQGREVFAIPGSIHSPVAKGCHQLIKQGAKLVESTEDILSEIQPILPLQPHFNTSPIGSLPERANASPEANTVLDSMGVDPIHFDVLLTATGLTVSALSTMLTLLELDGKISPLHGGKFQRLV